MKERRLVFISHANPEDNEFASWLGTRLTSAGYEVWTDMLKLVGGEAMWQDIGRIIKKEAALVVVILSRGSYQKDGVLDEIALSVTTGRELNKQQFVIPVRIDALPFSDFPEQLIRLTAIDFSPDWADGLSRLLTIFNDVRIPQSISDSGESLNAWRKYQLRKSATILPRRESAVSSWFLINSLPSHINFLRFKASQNMIDRAFKNFQSPVAQYMRLAASFADAASLRKEASDVPIEPAYRVPLDSFLEGRAGSGPEVAWREARKIVTRLLNQAWEQFAQNRGLVRCDFAHGAAWFVPLGIIEKNRAVFQDEKGKKRRRLLVGRSERRSVYWHFAVSGKVNIVGQKRMIFRPHVVFTDDGRTPLKGTSAVIRLRKGFCRNWWNDRWRDLLRAFASFLANGGEDFSLALGGSSFATIAASPMTFDVPLSIREVTSVSINEKDQDDDAEALDDLDDFNGGHFEDLFDDDIENGGTMS